MGRTAIIGCLLSALLLFFPLAYAIEPVTDANLATYLYMSVNGPTVNVKAMYLEASYFSQPNPEFYPIIVPQVPTDFYKPCYSIYPPSPNPFPCQFSTDSFSAHTGPLSSAPLYFTFDGNPVANIICSPAFTDSSGLASCTVTGFIDPSGNIIDLSTLQSCGSVGISFDGMYSPDGTKYYKPSYRSAVFCSPRSRPLSILGTAIFSVLSSSTYVPYCFPIIIIAGLLISSMYYSGRDPLSLFDLTTPRLPRVRQFRVKQGTAPQMMRSLARRYLIMQMRAERDIMASAKLAAKAKADEGKLEGSERRRFIQDHTEQAREVMRDYKKKLRVASASRPSKPLAEADYQDTQAKLNRIFDNLAPSNREGAAFKRYKYTRELIDGWLQIHHMSEQASKLTGASRGGGGGRVAQAIDRPLNWATKSVIRFEDTAFARTVAKIPVVRALVTTPIKTFDALVQFRATRRGAKAVRRNIYGAVLYNTLLSSKDKDDKSVRSLTALGRGVKRIFDTGRKDGQGKPVLSAFGKSVKWWNSWTFEGFENQVNLSSKKMNEIFHAAEDLRMKSAFSVNDYYRHYFASLFGLLPIISNPEVFEAEIKGGRFRDWVEADLKDLGSRYQQALASGGRASARTLKGQIADLNKIRKGIRDGTISGEKIKDVIGKNPSVYRNSNQVLRNSETISAEVAWITSGMQSGRYTLADALDEMRALAERHSTRADVANVVTREKIGRFREMEDIVRGKGMLVARHNGFYVPVEFERMDKERGMALRRDEQTQNAIGQLRKEMGEEKFLKLTNFEIQGRMYSNFIGKLRKDIGEEKFLKLAIPERLDRFDKTPVGDHVKKVNTELSRKYGAVSTLSKEAFNTRLKEVYGSLTRDMLPVNSGGTGTGGVMQRLLNLSNEINEDVRNQAGGIIFQGTDAQLRQSERDLQQSLMRMNMFGNSPTGMYLTEKLRSMGFANSQGLREAVENDLRRLNELYSNSKKNISNKRETDLYREQYAELNRAKHALADAVKKGQSISGIASELQRIAVASPLTHVNLHAHPFNYKVKTLDDLELFYKKGARAEVDNFNSQLDAAIRAGSFGSQAREKLLAATDKEAAAVRDKAFGSLVAGSGRFAQMWESRLWTTASIFPAIIDSRKAEVARMAALGYVLDDRGQIKKDKGQTIFSGNFMGQDSTKSVIDKVSPKQRMEVALKRSDFDISAYGKDTEANIGIARGYEKMAGFIAWRNMPGASWGDNSMAKLTQMIEQAREQVGTQRGMFLNLVTEGSKFYDKKFAAEFGNRKFDENEFQFDGDTYLKLINRGRTFSDMRRGLPFIISGDARGGMPMIEWNKDALEQQGKGIIVKKDGDIRDLAPLMARTSESWYGNLPLGMSILIRHQKPDGTTTWVYGDPNKDPETRSLLAAARYGAINQRTEIGNALAGLRTETDVSIAGDDKRRLKYDDTMQRIKVISTQDLQKYAWKNEGGFFGEMSGLDRTREAGRALAYGVGKMASTAVYSSMSDRVSNMQKWFAAQMQIRFALEALSHHTMYDSQSDEGVMQAGTDRFRLNSENADEKIRNDAEERLKRIYGHEPGLKDKISTQMELLKRGDNTFIGNLQSSWYNFRRNISAKTAKDIADAESEWYSARIELKALDKLRELREISHADYAAHKAQVEAEIEGYNDQKSYKSKLKDARKEFEEVTDMARAWTGSHTGMHEYGYGGIKNPFTMLRPISHFLDSKWEQGLKTDFYQTTESSAMRDPRNAIGAGPGLDYSFYVGYQTGQNVYERMSMWGVNALWETTLHNKTLPGLGAHKWFNDYLSYAMRKSSAYPAWFEMDPMYPGQPAQKRDKAAAFLFPFQSHHHTDFFHARFQNFMNYSGTGALMGSYMMSGSQDPSQRSFVKKYFFDKLFITSPSPTESHYGEHVTWKYLQRPVEQFRSFEYKLNDILAHNEQYRDAYNEWESLPEGSEKKQAIWKERFEPIVTIYDKRPRGTQEGHSGRDVQEDGSRNRFMELYQGFHTNVWKPTIPGMLDVDPISGRWKPFPQSASIIDKSSDARLRSMASFYLSRYDKETGLFISKDQFETHIDAYRDVYKKNDTALLHLAKLQSEYDMYSVLNSPGVWFISPAMGLARIGANTVASGFQWKTGSNTETHRRLRGVENVFGGGHMAGYDEFVEQATGYRATELHASEEHSRLYLKWLALQSYATAEKYRDWYENAARTRMKPWYPLLGREKEKELEETQKLTSKMKKGI